MGRADYLALGDWNAVCSMCGRKRKASELTKNWQGMYRCPEHNEPRQPQDFVRATPDIQTPPWVQPPGDQTNGTEFQQIGSDDADYNIRTIHTSEELGGTEVTKVVVTIMPGVSVTALTTGTGWPVAGGGAISTTIVINNYGFLGSVTNEDDTNVEIEYNDYPGSHRDEDSEVYVLEADFLDASSLPFFTQYWWGYDSGIVVAAMGDIDPTTYNGQTILYLLASSFIVGAITLNSSSFSLDGIVAQDFFSSLTVGSTTVYSATASGFTQSGGRSTWSWSGLLLEAADTYSVVIA